MTPSMIRRLVYKDLRIAARPSEGHIYVLEFSNGIVKIGRTVNIPARVAQISRLACPAFIVRSWFSPLHWKYGRNEFDLLNIYCEKAEFFCGEYMKGLNFDETVATAKEMPFDREPGLEIFNNYLQSYAGDLC